MCSRLPRFFSLCSRPSQSVLVFPSFTQFHPVSSSFTQFHPVSPNFTQFHPVSRSFTQFAPVCPDVFQFVPVCPKLSQCGPFFFSFVRLQMASNRIQFVRQRECGNENAIIIA